MPLRVLFVTTTYPLHRGDAIPGFVADLARTLVQNHRAKIKVLAPHHPGAAKFEMVDGVHIERFQYTLHPSRQCLAYGNGIPDNLKQNAHARWQLPGFLAAMAAAIWRNLDDTDVIHAHWVEPAFIASLANILTRKPLVVSIHSLKPKSNFLNGHTLSMADRVLFNSAYTMGQAAAKGYVCRGQVIYQGYDDRLFGTRLRSGGVERLHPVILRNCSERVPFSSSPGEAQPQVDSEGTSACGEYSGSFGVPQDDTPRTTSRCPIEIPATATIVTAIGRMIEVKGFHILAAAADAFLNGRPNVHLVFAGDGPCRAEIDSIVAGSQNRARIHFPGALNRHQVAQLLADSDIFVNPGAIDRAGRAEGLGITTIEAMASGLPAVGSRVGGIAETIVDQVTGLLVPPGDPIALSTAIARLLDDPQSRARMGQEGRRIARQRFNWTALASQVLRVYDDLIKPFS